VLVDDLLVEGLHCFVKITLVFLAGISKCENFSADVNKFLWLEKVFIVLFFFKLQEGLFEILFIMEMMSG